MIVRALDINGDWTFGKGKNDYLSGNTAVGQSIKTRLSSFLGDCFFATAEGIDWFNLLGGKSEIAIGLAERATILNTQSVTGILELSVRLNHNRGLTSTYNVQTTFGNVNDTFQYDIAG